MGQLDTVSLSDFRRFLKSLGLTLQGTEGGHEKWSRPGMSRPVVLQTHTDPVPRLHIRTNLDSAGVGVEMLKDFLKSKKQRKRSGK